MEISEGAFKEMFEDILATFTDSMNVIVTRKIT